MELAKYKACICEGSAENAIMDILLDNVGSFERLIRFQVACLDCYIKISQIREVPCTVLVSVPQPFCPAYRILPLNIVPGTAPCLLRDNQVTCRPSDL